MKLLGKVKNDFNVGTMSVVSDCNCICYTREMAAWSYDFSSVDF